MQEQERMQLLKLLGSITLQNLEEKHPNVQPGKGDDALLLLLRIYIRLTFGLTYTYFMQMTLEADALKN